MSSDDRYAAYRSGSTEPETVDVICAMVKALEPRIVIETGSFEGLTTERLFRVMEQFEHTSILYTVEADPDRYHVMMEKQWLTKHPSMTVCAVHQDALDYLASLQSDMVDFIFLDDDHSGDHVAHEIREAMRILRPGGVCVVHDVIGPFNLAPIVKVMGGVCLPFKRLHAAGGLGVLVRE